MSTRPAMLLVLSLIIFICGELRAQPATVRDTSGLPLSAPSDSAYRFRVSPLDEQFTGAEDDGEIEVPPGESDPDPGSPPWRFRWRTRISEKIQTGRGYSDGVYAGNKMKSYNRLTMTKGGWLSAGVLTEKDPGENGMADHLSGSLTIGGKGDPLGVVLGDFRIRAGQGLLFSNGRSFGKGAEVITPVMQTGWGIHGSPTADEFRYFRGVAGRVSLQSMSFATFISRRVHSALVAGDGTIRSLDESGYHRTAAEIRNRGRVKQGSWGFLTRIEPGDFLSLAGDLGLVLGLNVMHSTTSPLGEEGDPLPGHQVLERMVSIDLMIKNPAVLFGELAWRAGQVAGLAGALFTPTPEVSIILSGRSYPAYDGFVPVSGFGDRAGSRNERGMYAGIDFQLFSAASFHAYIDVFSSPLPSRDVVFPRRGVDGLLAFTLWKGEDFEFSARFRKRDVEKKNTSAEPGALQHPGNIPTTESRWRFEAAWRPGPRLQTMTRVDFSSVSPGVSSGVSPGGSSGADPVDEGLMILVDVGTELIRNLRVKCRTILFATDSYASRLYETESDLPGSLINGIVYGHGARWYILITWKPAAPVRISARFSRLFLGERKTLGSGMEEIPGNIEERAGVQLDVEF